MFKQLFMLIGLFCVTCSVIADDIHTCISGDCALSLTGPSQGTLECSPDSKHPSTLTLTFTVTNHTQYPIGFTPSIGGANPSPSSLAVAGGTCVNDIVKPHSSCTVEVIITAGLCSAITSPPQIFHAALDIQPNINQGKLTQPFTITVEDVLTFVTVASGSQPLSSGSGPYATLLAVHNVNNQWKTLTLPGTVTSGALNSSTCSNNTTTATCLAVGKDTSIEAIGQTLLYASQDGGVTWALPTIATFPQSGTFYGAACNQASPATCWVVGQLQSPTGGAIVLSTTNGGSTWTPSMPTTLTNPPNGLSVSSILYGTACDASGNCFAIGRDFSASSIYAGFIATASNVIPFTAQSFIDTDCAGSVCVAVGYTGAGNVSANGFLTLSRDNWATRTDVMLGGAQDFLTGVACTQTTQVQCVAVGYTDTSPSTPLLYVNNDVIGNPSNWASQKVFVTSTPAKLFSTACTTDGSKPICVIGGYQTNASVEVALLKQTEDLINWTDVSPGVNGPFFANACTRAGAKIICTAAGAKNQSGNVPIYYVNEDITGTGTWAAATLSPALPASGCFSNAGASGSSTGALLFPNLDASICNVPVF